MSEEIAIFAERLNNLRDGTVISRAEIQYPLMDSMDTVSVPLGVTDYYRLEIIAGGGWAFAELHVIREMEEELHERAKKLTKGRTLKPFGSQLVLYESINHHPAIFLDWQGSKTVDDFARLRNWQYKGRASIEGRILWTVERTRRGWIAT